MKILKKYMFLFLPIIVAVLAFCLFIYFIQDVALFHPNSDSYSREYILSQSKFAEVKIDGNGKTYHGIMRLTDENIDEPSPIIIMFTGNATNAAQTMNSMDTDRTWKCFLDYNFLIMDYPGYGLNDGLPSADNICKEALLAYDYVSELSYVDKTRIIVGGFSIGTGPAVYLAANRDIAGLFLLAPYASGYDLYNSVLPIFHGPLRLLVKHKFTSDQYAQSITAPVLIVASKSDEVVPYSSSEKLKSCFPAEPTFIVLSNVVHNGILYNSITLNSIKDFLEANNRLK